MKNTTKVELVSDREVVATRVINGPPHLVWEAWTKADLFRQWWVPKSFPIKLLSCELDVRVGGTYRLVFATGEQQTMAFFGKYLEVEPTKRLVWTNEEGGVETAAITTVTFEERDGKTVVRMSDLHPSTAALEASGGHEAWPETFEQLDLMISR